MSTFDNVVELTLEFKSLAEQEPLIRKIEAGFNECFNAFLAVLREECDTPAPGLIPATQTLGVRSEELFRGLQEYIGREVTRAMAEESNGLLRLICEEEL